MTVLKKLTQEEIDIITLIESRDFCDEVIHDQSLENLKQNGYIDLHPMWPKEDQPEEVRWVGSSFLRITIDEYLNFARELRLKKNEQIKKLGISKARENEIAERYYDGSFGPDNHPLMRRPE